MIPGVLGSQIWASPWQTRLVLTNRYRSRPVLQTLLVAASLFGLGCGTAAVAEANMSTALFRAKIKGTQINTWNANYKSSERCYPSYSGKGREVIRFRSVGWVPVSVVMYNNARYAAFRKQDWTASFFTPKRFDPPAFRVRGTVTRSSQYRESELPLECAVGDGEGDWEPPKRDCGRKPIRNRTLVAKADVSTGRLTLENVRGLYPSQGAFKNCQIFGWAWPTFLVHDDRHRTAGVDLDVKRTLRNKRFKRLIFIGRGKSRHTMRGVRGNTRIEWTMDLRRVR